MKNLSENISIEELLYVASEELKHSRNPFVILILASFEYFENRKNTLYKSTIF